MELKALRWPAFAIILIGFTFTWHGCTSDQESPRQEDGVVEVGAVLPLTGNASVLGEYARKGINTAVDVVNKSGGVRGDSLSVVYGDSKNDPKEGISAYRKLSSSYDISTVITSMSSVSNALVPLADKNEDVLFATTVSEADFPNQSPWAFRLFITASIDAKKAANFAIDSLGSKRSSVLYVSDDFGRSFYNVFKESYESKGGKIIVSESFSRGRTDFRNILTSKVKPTNTDLIYLLGYTRSLGVLINQIREVGIEAPILSIATVSLPYVRKQAGQSMVGTYYTSVLFDPANARSKKSKRFLRVYNDKYTDNPNYFTAFAFDSMMILANAIRNSGNNARSIRKYLQNMEGYEGLTGNIKFDKKGDASFQMTVRRINQQDIIANE